MKTLWHNVIATVAIVSSAAWAQAPGPSYVATRLNVYTATAALWRTDGGFQSTIRLKNVLSASPIDVNVTLYMQDGSPYALPAVHLGNSAVATVSVNAALANAPASLSGHLSHAGSATFQYNYDWAGAVLGSISILDTVLSLQYLSTFYFPEPTPAAGTSTGTGTQMIEGMWWKYSATSSIFLSAANATNNPATANIALFDNLHQPLGQIQVSLASHASRLVVLDSLIGPGPSALLGGVEVSYSGGPQTMLFSGGVEDDSVGYSATLRLSAPMFMNVTQGASTTPPAACTMAAAGLMVGTPDPMEGFPSTVSFSMFGFVRNTNAAPLTVHGLANYMDNSGPHNILLPDQTLQPGEVRNLNLANSIQLPFQNGSANLSVTFSAPCDSLLLETGSVDTTGNYVFEVLPQAVGMRQGSISQFWQVGAGTDTMYALWNPSSTPEDLIASVYYGSGSVYRYPLHLGPNASAMISIKELIQNAVPDANGNIIPAGVKNGSLTVTNSSPDIRNLANFVMASGIFNPLAGTCCTQPVDCTGATSTEFSPSTFSVADGGYSTFAFYIVYDDGSTNDYTAAATYSSSSNISAIAGEVAGLSPGSATLSATVSGGVPEYTPSYCGGGACPTGGYGGSTSGTVTDVTPVITGINPSDWNAGATTPVTFTGQYFGTNTPTLNFNPSSGITYTISSSNDTQIVANITVSAGTPAETVAVTVTNGGYNGQQFQGGTGQSAQSMAANAQVQAAAPATEVTVVGWVNASAITLPTGENSTLQSDLNSTVYCPRDILAWAAGIKTDIFSSADVAYANTYLLQNSGNPAPPANVTKSYVSSGNFRIFNDFGSSSGGTYQVGTTPYPCGTGVVANWLSASAQQNPYSGPGTSGSGQSYQLSEGRVGTTGQAVSLTLNGTTVPWTWSVIEFNSSGTPTYSQVAIFPTYSVYVNGTLTATYPQSAVSTFIALNASYQLTPSQIP
jgi:hypothetical protein